jgi:hypothetical protein
MGFRPTPRLGDFGWPALPLLPYSESRQRGPGRFVATISRPRSQSPDRTGPLHPGGHVGLMGSREGRGVGGSGPSSARSVPDERSRARMPAAADSVTRVTATNPSPREPPEGLGPVVRTPAPLGPLRGEAPTGPPAVRAPPRGLGRTAMLPRMGTEESKVTPGELRAAMNEVSELLEKAAKGVTQGPSRFSNPETTALA